MWVASFKCSFPSKFFQIIASAPSLGKESSKWSPLIMGKHDNCPWLLPTSFSSWTLPISSFEVNYPWLLFPWGNGLKGGGLKEVALYVPFSNNTYPMWFAQSLTLMYINWKGCHEVSNICFYLAIGEIPKSCFNWEEPQCCCKKYS
jgi:hypothetical protein